jgi:hypothetical protein
MGICGISQSTSTHSINGSPTSNCKPSTYNNNSTNATKTAAARATNRELTTRLNAVASM